MTEMYSREIWWDSANYLDEHNCRWQLYNTEHSELPSANPADHPGELFGVFCKGLEENVPNVMGIGCMVDPLYEIC